jgi:hypothetical protein
MPEVVITVDERPLPEVVEVNTGAIGAAGPPGPAGATGLPGIVRVNHGAVASTPRPAGAAIVLWVGSVNPTYRDESSDLIAWVP